MEWFEEACHARWRQRIRMETVLHRQQSALQDLLVFESADFGRVLVLDGMLQTTERDEYIYHEMISHVPLLAHGSARQVLIIGGGDGGTLEEVLKHPAVERATLVELDPAVIEVSRRWLPEISRGAFDHPRSEIVIADGVQYVRETDRRFDVIIVDSTDARGPGEVLFGRSFYDLCHRCLEPGGVFVNQTGSTFGEEPALRPAQRRLRASFVEVDFYTVSLPTYLGGPFTFSFASDDSAKRGRSLAELRARECPPGLRHYAPEVHVAAFAHPPWLSQIAAS
jgi:spermidine synthase